MIIRKKAVIILCITYIVTGCAWLFPAHSKTNTHQKLPSSSVTKAPGGSRDNWRYIGTTTDGALIVELNNNSITQINSNNLQIFSFEDRKTIVNPNQYPYPPHQAHFKYMINSWQMDCKNKQYLLLTSKTFDKNANLLVNLDYTNNNEVKWLKFGEGTIADLEYKFICLNQNRNLGY